MENLPKDIYLTIDIDHEPTNDFNELDTELVYWGTKRDDVSDIHYRLVEPVFFIDDVRALIGQFNNKEISIGKLVELLNKKTGDE